MIFAGRRPRRSVELQNVKRSVEYTQDSIPTEWQSKCLIHITGEIFFQKFECRLMLEPKS